MPNPGPVSSAPADRDLIAQAAGGDERAIGQLQAPIRYGAYTVAYRISGQRADAEEVVIESFAQAWRDAARFVMRRYERASTLITSNRPVDDWGKLLGDTAAVTALLDRLLHHAHVLTCGPRSWRTRLQADQRAS